VAPGSGYGRYAWQLAYRKRAALGALAVQGIEPTGKPRRTDHAQVERFRVGQHILRPIDELGEVIQIRRLYLILEWRDLGVRRRNREKQPRGPKGDYCPIQQ
jgi:hypothetical protein